DAGRHELLVLGEGRPGLDVVRERHLLGQPEVAREPVPDLEVLVVLDPVPVDRRDAADQLDLTAGGHRPLSMIVVKATARAGVTACTRRNPRSRCPRAPSGAGAR